jgi:hypothetical protein
VAISCLTLVIADLGVLAAPEPGVRLLGRRPTVQSICKYADNIRWPRGDDFNDKPQDAFWRRFQGSARIFRSRTELSGLGS